MVTKVQERSEIDQFKLWNVSKQKIFEKMYRKPICYKSKSKAYDMWTGKAITGDLKEYKVVNTTKRTYKQTDGNVMIFEAHKSYQFIRWFNISVYAKVGKKADIMITEVMRYIFSPTNRIYFGRVRTYVMFYSWAWVLTTNLNYHNLNLKQYEFIPNGVIKHSMINRFKKVHFAKELYPYTVEYLTEIMKGSYQYETLVEIGHTDIAKYFLAKNKNIESYWAQIKIALRNNYNIFQQVKENWYYSGCGLWLDEVDNIRSLGLDDRSPKYICPKNLNKAHGIHNARVTSIRHSKQALVQLRNDMAKNQHYIKVHKKYLNKIIETNEFIIRPLQDIPEFKTEADKMHHCLFSAKYYNRDNSLILTVRDKNNRRLETCEIDIEAKSINQCFGACDQYTEYHNKILNTVKRNMNMLLG